MFIVMFVVYLLIKLILLGVGIGLGFLLRWLMPEIDLGLCILIGVVATGMALHFFTRLWASVNELRDDEFEELEQKTGGKVKLYSLEALASRRRIRGRPRHT